MTARHHHYLSQCYLKGFTKGRAKNSKLTVIDLGEKKSFETIPRNVGGIRDFNRINIEGIDPNILESSLAEFESQAATALKKLNEERSFTGEIKDIILNLIALLAVRSPHRREHMRKFHVEVADKMMGLALQSKEKWQSDIDKMRASDPEFTINVTYEETKAFFDEKKYTIEVAREHHIRLEMVQVEAILPCLFGRKWILIQSNTDTGPFITSDSPVHLSWKNPAEIPPFYRESPGFGLMETEVYFPVSQDLALSGEFELKEGKVEATEELVALCNSTVLHGFYKQVYTPKTSFKFYGKNDEILNGSRIFSAIDALKKGN